MPNRILREGILTSERVNALGPQAEILYRRLMSVVDDYGRYHGHPGLIRAACYPLRVDQVREADISRWLTEVQLAGLIVLYSVDGKRYLQLLDTRWQVRANASKFPDSLRADVSTCAQMLADAPVVVVVDEVVSVDVGEDDSCGEVAKGDSPPKQGPLMVFPCKGEGPKEWPLMQDRVDQFIESFPGIDVLGECRKARSWCLNAGTKQKTYRGMPAFLNGWMTRAQDRSSSNGSRNANNRNHAGERFEGDSGKASASVNGVF